MMIGRRVYPDEKVKMHDLQPGDYAKSTDGIWWLRVPSGTWGQIKPSIHKIIEHEDGTITVSPSILITVPGQNEKNWHGYLEKGIWKEC